jgi:hypothetical protein
MALHPSPSTRRGLCKTDYSTCGDGKIREVSGCKKNRK